MLLRKDIIKILKDMNLPLEDFWVTSGAALVIHGVKESTGDIDLGCTTNLAKHFLERGCKYKVTEDNSKIIEVNNELELIENWFVDKIEIIDGLPVASLESIKKQKAKLGREKDIRDIELIDEFMKK